MTINERVKHFRKDVLHISQTEFAVSLGMKQTGVSYMAVSYTHLDVYKRQGLGSVNVNSNNDPATFPCVCFQSFLLGFQ